MEVTIETDEYEIVFEVVHYRDGFDHEFGVQSWEVFTAKEIVSVLSLETNEPVVLDHSNSETLFDKYRTKAEELAEKEFAKYEE